MSSRTNCDRNLAILKEVAENGDEIPLGETRNSGQTVVDIENSDNSNSNYENFMNKCLQGCCVFIKSFLEKTSSFFRKFWKLIALAIALAIILYIIYQRFIIVHLYDYTATTQYDENTWTRISNPDIIITETIPRVNPGILSKKLDPIRKKRSKLSDNFLSFFEFDSSSAEQIKRCKKDNWESEKCEALLDMLYQMNNKIDHLNTKFDHQFPQNKTLIKLFRPKLVIEDTKARKGKMMSEAKSSKISILLDNISTEVPIELTKNTSETNLHPAKTTDSTTVKILKTTKTFGDNIDFRSVENLDGSITQNVNMATTKIEESTTDGTSKTKKGKMISEEKNSKISVLQDNISPEVPIELTENTSEIDLNQTKTTDSTTVEIEKTTKNFGDNIDFRNVENSDASTTQNVDMTSTKIEESATDGTSKTESSKISVLQDNISPEVPIELTESTSEIDSDPAKATDITTVKIVRTTDTFGNNIDFRNVENLDVLTTQNVDMTSTKIEASTTDGLSNNFQFKTVSTGVFDDKEITSEGTTIGKFIDLISTPSQARENFPTASEDFTTTEKLTSETTTFQTDRTPIPNEARENINTLETNFNDFTSTERFTSETFTTLEQTESTSSPTKIDENDSEISPPVITETVSESIQRKSFVEDETESFQAFPSTVTEKRQTFSQENTPTNFMRNLERTTFAFLPKTSQFPIDDSLKTTTTASAENRQENSIEEEFQTSTVTTVSTENSLGDPTFESTSLNLLLNTLLDSRENLSMSQTTTELSDDIILAQSRLVDDSFSPISETIKASQQLKFNPGNFDSKPICFYRPNFDPSINNEHFFSPSQAVARLETPTNYPGYPFYGYNGYNYPLQGYNPIPYSYPYGGYFNADSIPKYQFNPYQPAVPYYCSSPQLGFTNSDWAKLAEHGFLAKTENRGKTASFRSFDSPLMEDIRETNLECPEGSKACADGSSCIKAGKWCDGETDCPDISDEIGCSCKNRVDVARLCDGYFDCPNGEDELGCFGCPLSKFSCNDWSNDRKERATCVPLNQRCDGTFDCPNGQDEAECSSLMPIISQHQIFHVSYSSGFLHRNFRGQWFPVCFDSRPNHRWALEACGNEVGPETMSPNYKTLQVPATYTDPFVHQMVQGDVSVIPSCLSALHVQCPMVVCGTRLNSWERPRMSYFESEDLRLKRSLKNVQDDILGEGRVVGGIASKPAAWPWVIALYRNGLFHCGGVLISDSWILTAAHCVFKYWQHYYEVQAGMLRRFSFSPMEQIRPVSFVVIHENYDRSSMKNDLALLKLQSPLLFNRWVRPVCLPSQVTAGNSWLWGPDPETMCTAVGWGATVEHGPDPDHMRQVEVPILSKCKHREDQEGAEICAGFEEGGRDACQGDSGGPLLCPNPKSPKQWYVAGIVSHGEGCARPDEPGVYTRVSLYLNWISKNTDESSMVPGKRPLSTCPGLTCASNGGKCIPRRQKCDNTIHCLMAEDEINCQNVKKMPDLIRETLNSLLMAKNSATMRMPIERVAENETTTTNISTPSSDIIKNITVEDKMDEKLINITKEFETTNSLGPDQESSTNNNVNFKTPSVPESTILPDFMQTSTMNSDASTLEDNHFTENSEVVVTSTVNTEVAENVTEITSTSTTMNTRTTERILVIPVWPEDLHFSNEDNIEAPIKIALPELHDFTCTKIHQRIPIQLRCDKKFDCEDGTDELNCMCKEILQKTHPNLICDGYLDCLDHSDEENCYNCSSEFFYCRLSQKCVAPSLRCDGKYDCRYKEDERDCYTLTDGNEVQMDVEARPKLRRSGIITTNKNNSWFPLCYEHWDQAAATTAAEVCNYLGYLSFESHQKQKSSLKELKVLTTDEENVSLTMPNGTNIECDGLLVSCTPEIISKKEDFRVANIRTNDGLDSYDWPWFTAIFLEGELICSGILIYPHWVITSNTCTEKINIKFDYVTTMFGMGKKILRVPGPFEQIRVVDEIIRHEKADISLLHLADSVELSHHVQVLPLRNINIEAGSKDTCVAVGIDKFSSLQSILLQPILSNCSPEKRCFKQISRTDACTNSTRSWSGGIFCLSPTVGWYPSVIYYSNKGVCSFLTTRMYTSIASVMKQIQSSIRIRVFHKNTATCNGFRCALGNCISIHKICDGNPQCRNHEDETSESCLKRTEICSLSNDCECLQNQLRCKNGNCVDKSRFCDFVDDCGDGSDEPEICNCVAYLNLTRPELICDGKLNCGDKLDELDCGCDESSFKCSISGKCLPKYFVCDGAQDCPDGEDEKHCLGLKTVKNESSWQGYLYQQSFGIWHAKCFAHSNLTMYEREDMCTGLGVKVAQNDVLKARPAVGDELLQPIADKFQLVRINRWNQLLMRPSNVYVTMKNRTEPCLLLKMLCF